METPLRAVVLWLCKADVIDRIEVQTARRPVLWLDSQEFSRSLLNSCESSYR
jgi:hypothetical protein